MKLKSSFVFVLVIMMTFASSTLAYKNDSNKDIEQKAKDLQAKFKNELPNILKNHYEKSIHIQKSEMNKLDKKIILDKSNDLETLKLSFKKPVVIYKEKLDSVSITTLNSYTAASAQYKVSVDSTIVLYAGVSVTVTNETSAWRKYYGGSVNYYYKMDKINCFWSTDNVASGDSDNYGGYVKEMEINADQSGTVYIDGTDSHPVDYYKIVNYSSSDSDGSHSQTFNHSTYHLAGGGTGCCRTHTFFTIVFVGPGYPYTHTIIEETLSGWGAASSD